MSSAAEKITEIFADYESQIGYIDAIRAGHDVKRAIPNLALSPDQVTRKTLDVPSQRFLHSGAHAFLEALPDGRAIWTDDYISRVKASGLLGVGRENGKPTLLASDIEKFSLVSFWMRALFLRGFEVAVFVDDSKSNLAKEASIISDMNVETPDPYFVLEDDEKSYSEVVLCPNPRLIVPTIDDIPLQWSLFTGDQEPRKTFWFSDHNNVLLDTEAFKQYLMFEFPQQFEEYV